MRCVAQWGCAVVIGATSGCADSDADPCSPYTNVPAATDVVIHIVNQRSAPVYVDGVCGIEFDVEAGGVHHPGELSSMNQTCFVSKTKPFPCCDCAFAGTAIEPGESLETHWSGLFFDAAEMPRECYLHHNGTAPLPLCAQPTVAPPGPMRLVPHVYATGGTGLWPVVSDPIEVGKDFVHGSDVVVDVMVE